MIIKFGENYRKNVYDEPILLNIETEEEGETLPGKIYDMISF